MPHCLVGQFLHAEFHRPKRLRRNSACCRRAIRNRIPGRLGRLAGRYGRLDDEKVWRGEGGVSSVICKVTARKAAISIFPCNFSLDVRSTAFLWAFFSVFTRNPLTPPSLLHKVSPNRDVMVSQILTSREELQWRR